MKFLNLSVVSQKKTGSCYFYLVLKSEGSLGRITPGQFIMLGFADRCEPLLPRPMGFFQVLEERNDSTTFSIGYVVVGKGTDILSVLKPGDMLKGTGPLGKGWDIGSVTGKAVMVAGGIGITPFYQLAKELKTLKKEVILLYGAKSASDLVFLEEFKKLGIETVEYTEDGSAGKRGLVSEGLSDYLDGDASVFACGPYAMLKTVNEVCADAGVDPQLSFDKRMACGFGVCLGCNIAVKDSNGGSKYVRVCKEGPVFRGGEVVW